MKTHINNISLFFLSLFFALSVQATTTPVKEKKQVVKEAVAQLNYLYKKNGIAATKKSNKWYVYFVGGNLNDLKYVINKSDKQFAETYLKRLNDSLVNVNTQVNSKAAVYVAFTDYKQIFNTPIFPKEYNTEALKLLHIDNLIQNNKETNSYNIDSLKNAKTGYKSYREELRNLIIEVYENSDLSKSDKENIIMPFTNYTIRNILKPDKNYDKKTVFAYTMYTPKLKEDIVKGHFNKIYKTNKQKLNEQGLTSSEKNMLSAVASLNIWFNGVRPPYKECEELLVAYKDSPLMQHAALKNTILENPCILKNMVPWGDSIPKSQWMEELEMLIAAPLYAALCIPAASIAGGAGVFEYLQAQAATFTAKKAKDIALAAAMNITMQTLINYYWDEEVVAITNENERWKKAVEKISKISLGKDVLAAALEFSLRADLVADCLEGAIADNELNWSKLDFDPAKFEIKPEKCATNVAINLFAKPVLQGASTVLKRLKVLVTNKPNLFIKGWRRMKRDMPAELGDEFLKYIEDIADAVDFKKDAQNFADKYVYAAIDVEQALSEAVEEYATEVVSTTAAQQFENTIKNAATESTLLIRGAVPKVLADNTTKLVKKIGANIKLQFSVDNVPTNIQATLLEELEDKTYRLVFVNSSTDNALENFLKKTSPNRKKVIDALKNEKAAFTATATGTNATAIDINGKNIDIVEVELRTPKANTDDFDSEVIVNKNLSVEDELSLYINLLMNRSIRSNIIDLDESKVIAKKYFDRITDNSSDYLEAYTVHLDDFDTWYKKIFISDLFEAHHIIPENVLRKNISLQKILDWARKNNKTWNFGDIDNGIMLQTRRKNNLGEVVGDHANHPKYDLQITQKIDNIFDQSIGNMSDAFNDLVDFVDDLKIQLNSDVVEGSQIVNNITIP